MRILFVSIYFPEDLRTATQGIHKRMNLFIDGLKGIAELDMLFYVPDHIDRSPAAIARLETKLAAHWQTPLRLFLAPLATLPSSKLKQQLNGMFSMFGQYASTSQPAQIAAFDRCLDRQPDCVFIFRLPSACPALLTQRPLPPVIMDLDDIEHIKLMRQIRQPPTRLRTQLYYLQIPALWRGEKRAIRATHTTSVCSDHDRQYLTKRHLPNIAVIPNAIHIPPPQPLTTAPTLLLLGGYYYFPNLNGANFLIDQVFPQVRRQIPTAKLIIAGPQPQLIRSYNSPPPGVEFTGFVENLDSLYQRSRVVCCPIFSGGGTRVKMIEAAAYGKSIVATRIGAEGLELRDRQDYLLRNDAKGFADACITLLKDDTLSHTLGQQARATAIATYDRQNIIKTIQSHILKVIDKTTPPINHQTLTAR